MTICFLFRYDRLYNQTWKELLGCLGLGFIIVSVILFDNRHIPPFPNCYTLLPTSGAALIILFADEKTFVGSLLSKRLLRWIGLISYSAYLWHQPLFAFIRLRYGETLPLSHTMIIISAVLLLSIFSYRFIEQPFRQRKRISRERLFISASVATLLTFIVALFLIRTANNRSLPPTDEGDDSYLADLKTHGSLSYTWTGYNRHRGLIPFSNDTTSTKQRLILIGDSFSQDFHNIITEGKYLTNYEISPYYIFSGCQIYMGPEDRQQFVLAKDKQRCASHGEDIKYALPVIRQAHVIILTISWHEWSAIRLPTTIKSLNLTKEQKLLIIGTKHFGAVQPMLYVNKSKEHRISQYQYPLPNFVNVNQLLERIVDQSIFANVMKMICTGINNTCPLFTKDGKLISYDGLHLTRYGALYVGKVIFNQKPLNQL